MDLVHNAKYCKLNYRNSFIHIFKAFNTKYYFKPMIVQYYNLQSLKHLKYIPLFYYLYSLDINYTCMFLSLEEY